MTAHRAGQIGPPRVPVALLSIVDIGRAVLAGLNTALAMPTLKRRNARAKSEHVVLVASDARILGRGPVVGATGVILPTLQAAIIKHADVVCQL